MTELQEKGVSHEEIRAWAEKNNHLCTEDLTRMFNEYYGKRNWLNRKGESLKGWKSAYMAYIRILENTVDVPNPRKAIQNAALDAAHALEDPIPLKEPEEILEGRYQSIHALEAPDATVPEGYVQETYVGTGSATFPLHEEDVEMTSIAKMLALAAGLLAATVLSVGLAWKYSLLERLLEYLR
jgi:hypothetical protein